MYQTIGTYEFLTSYGPCAVPKLRTLHDGLTMFESMIEHIIVDELIYNSHGIDVNWSSTS